MTMPQIKPTITFIIPVQNTQDFIIEQINTIFKFSENYRGFCEILVASDEIENARLKLAWTAMELNKITHPQVRTRMIRFASKTNPSDLIQTTISQSLGQKIVVATTSSEILNARIDDITQRDILFIDYALDLNTLQDNLD